MFLVIEYVNGGDLMFHMQRQRKLPEEHARWVQIHGEHGPGDRPQASREKRAMKWGQKVAEGRFCWGVRNSRTSRGF